MGNEEIKSDFRRCCHPRLTCFLLDSQGKYLSTEEPFSPTTQYWCEYVRPLFGRKHLFVPKSMEFSNTKIRLVYPSSVYCLDREKASRKSLSTNFNEGELWKILRAVLRGVNEWFTQFPSYHPTEINTYNILVDSEGQLRLLTPLSFCPSSDFPLNKKTKCTAPHCSTPQSLEKCCVYSTGYMLLELSTMASENTDSYHRLRYLVGLTYFSKDFKRAVVKMIRNSPQYRPSLRQCIALSLVNKQPANYKYNQQ